MSSTIIECKKSGLSTHKRRETNEIAVCHQRNQVVFCDNFVQVELFLPETTVEETPLKVESPSTSQEIEAQKELATEGQNRINTTPTSDSERN